MTIQRIALIMTIVVALVLLSLGIAAAFVKLDFTTAVHGLVEPSRVFPAVVAQAGHVQTVAPQGPVKAGDTLLQIESVALQTELGIITQGIHTLELEIAREAPPVGNPRRRFDLGQQLAARQREALKIRTQLASRLVLAPFGGRVVASHVHAGEWATPSDEPAVVLVDESSWRFEATVDPGLMREIRVGAPAQIRVAAYPYRTYGALAATVAGIELTQTATGDPAYDVKLSLAETPSMPLLMGQRATALITSFHGTIFQYLTLDD